MNRGAATATATGTGGAGGDGGLFFNGAVGVSGNGGNGGNGTANATATATGGGAATATAAATGGAAGTAFGTGVNGVGGAGNATASATTSRGAEAESLATASGSPANAQSTAATSLGRVLLAQTVASASTASKATTNAIVQAGDGQMLVNPGQSAYAFATALPAKSYSTALIGGASMVADALLGPGEAVFGTSILGANLSGDGSPADTYSASSTFDFAYRGDLILGLIAPLDGAPTDFQKIDFTVTVDGTEALTRSFTSLATADAFFADDVLNLGPVTGVADVMFSYDLVAGGSGGYGMDLAFGGAVPEPSTWAMMLMGFAGLGYAALRRARESQSALDCPRT